MFYKIDVFENFANIDRKTSVFESFFYKVAGLKRLHYEWTPYNKTPYTIKLAYD